MTNQIQLTVIIPVYNRASLVKRTLESVEQQTLRPLRVILVDNNSTDIIPLRRSGNGKPSTSSPTS